MTKRYDMIKIDDILNATRGGLDIILDIYPQARVCVDNPKKHFAMRNERTPSASLRQYDSKNHGRIWQVTDFGGDSHGKNAVDLYMREHGMDKSRFFEALLQLAARYNVTDELDKSVNRPRIEQREAHADEPDGSRKFELNEKLSEYELKVLGPNVTQEHAQALHWYSVKWITNTKDRKTTVKYSTEHYPIFMRECVVEKAHGDVSEKKFYKVYEPLNCDKGFRFTYTPTGAKPQRYINGLEELKEAYRKYNASEEAALHSTDPEAPYKEKKLPEAVICSGERDSLCCRSMGYMPVWFNSETYQLSGEEYKEIMKYVDVLYNVPDLDETGRRKGKELALKFIDIRTVWLPSWLSDYRDNRGKPRKDLRDWMELRREKKDFKNLVKVAMPARFWTSTRNKDGKLKHEINTAYLLNFLQMNGFYILHDEDSDIPQFIKVDGYKVKRITTKVIREFVFNWIQNRYEDIEILNLMLNTMKLTSSTLESLKDYDPDFRTYSQNSQTFFFDNCTVRVHKKDGGEDNGYDIQKAEQGGFSNYVWDENVIPHRFQQLPDMFEIKAEDYADHETYDIKILDCKSNFFRYLINSSRIHWRKELEVAFAGKEEEGKEYAANNRFRIDGDGLSVMDIWEQKQNLLSKIFCLGYMLHHYKSVSRAWAPMAMDNKIGETNECNGRSGKSFFFSALSLVMKTVKLSGRNPKLMDNPHVFDQVTKHTQLMLVDDCDSKLELGLFYDNITSDMTVNPKNNRSFTIPFRESPKLAFTTNYIPREFSPSTEARSLYLVFSDYYHQKTEDNDYRESRSIRDDFHKDLYGESYTEEEWNADLNFFVQCCQFYLQHVDYGVKFQPPMANIMTRKLKAEMGENFEEWAEGYFAENEDELTSHLNKFIQREDVKDDYVRYSNVKGLTMQGFNRKLKAFVSLCPWIDSLNPHEYCNASGRIQRKIVVDNKPQTKDMIYVRTVEEAQRLNGKETKGDENAYDMFGNPMPF